MHAPGVPAGVGAVAGADYTRRIDDGALTLPAQRVQSERPSERFSGLLWVAAALAAAVAAALVATPILERDATEEAEARLAAALNAGSADIARSLADARVRAVELAASPRVQRALAGRDAGAIRSIEQRNPHVSITLGTTSAPRSASTPVVTATVTDGRTVLGRVHVGVPLAPLVADAGRRSNVQLAVVQRGRIATGPARGTQLRVPLRDPVDVRISRERYRALATPLGDEAGGAMLVALAPHASIAATARSRRNFVFVAALAALVAIALLASAAQRARRAARAEPRQRAHRISSREALALVGDALAATHEPGALLEIILTTAVEATGAAGGCLLYDGAEVARVGAIPDVEPLDVELAAGGGAGTLRLFPPPAGFTHDDVTLASSLASQASIALENAHLHRLVERQAATDELTDLANRRTFTDALAGELRRSVRSGSPFGLVIVDLDDFKRVNDSYGHTTGDRVLAGFARIVEQELREIDVAARIGGEEFALLLPETDAAGAAAVAERLREALALAEFDAGDGRTLRITASFGVTTYVADRSAEQLLVAADRALYAAKAAGKDRVVVADAATGRRPAQS